MLDSNQLELIGGYSYSSSRLWTKGANEVPVSVKLNLSYQPGKPGWKPSKAMPYSNVNPDFYRIYKYNQLANLAMSKKLSLSLKGEVTFKSEVEKLATMFDGSEEVIGVMTAPVYIREIFLP